MSTQRSVVEVLERALELLGPNGENWCKGASYADSAGSTYTTDRRPTFAVKCCASAAIIDSEEKGRRHWNKSPAYKAFGAVIDSDDIPEWNDASGRTFPEVAAKFREAIELAKAEEGQ